MNELKIVVRTTSLLNIYKVVKIVSINQVGWLLELTALRRSYSGVS
jgi:hypothetical protein